MAVIRERGKAEQLAPFGELVDHQVAARSFEDPVELGSLVRGPLTGAA
jgi:hypothetical protein